MLDWHLRQIYHPLEIKLLLLLLFYFTNIIIITIINIKCRRRIFLTGIFFTLAIRGEHCVKTILNLIP